MARLPFDPGKMAAASLPAKPADAVLTVSQLADRIDGALKQGIPSSVRVAGEVSGFRDRTHWYFDMKDEQAVVSAVMFASAAKKAGFVPENGQQVVAKGRVEYYAKGGKVSFIVERLEPVGAGALEVAFRKLCDELRALGWFAPERKRAVPNFPRRIAVVTSRTGAALQDVLVTMKKRCPAVGVLVADVRVQGDGAAGEIAGAIRDLSARARRLGVDAILVTRGGGSMEDLWCFNDRLVASAIVECAVPVVAAIGHETDTTIAELVADERCATPTQAAMRLTPDAAALLRQVDSLQRRMGGLLRNRLRLDTQRLATAARHPAFSDPAALVERARDALDAAADRAAAGIRERVLLAHREADRAAGRLDRVRPTALHAGLRVRVDAVGARLGQAARVLVRSASDRVGSLERTLAGVSPLAVLARGYSVTLGPDGAAVLDPARLREGDRLTTRLAMGLVVSRVDGVGASGADSTGAPITPPITPPVTPPVAPPHRPAAPRRGGRRSDDAPGLFGGV